MTLINSPVSPHPTPSTALLKPELIASLPKIRDPKISPDGEWILYQVMPFYTPFRSSSSPSSKETPSPYASPTHVSSELWISPTTHPTPPNTKTGADGTSSASARRLMPADTTCDDSQGVWHPHGHRVFFIRRRKGAGQSIKGRARGEIHVFDMCSSDSQEAIPLLSSQNSELNVKSFQISPDGKRVILASSVPSAPDNADPKVYSATSTSSSATPNTQLWLYDLSSNEIRSLVNNSKQVESYLWSANSTAVLVRYKVGEMSSLDRVSIQESGDVERLNRSNGCTNEHRELMIYPFAPSGLTLSLASGHLIDVQNYVQENRIDARAMFIRDLGSGQLGRSESGSSKVERMYGLDEDAVRIVNMLPSPITGCTPEHSYAGMVAVEVSSDIDTRIDIVTFPPSGELRTLNEAPLQPKVQALFHTAHDWAIWFGAWDARYVRTPSGGMEYVLAAVLSSGVRGLGVELWTGRVQEGESVPMILPMSATHRGSNGNGTTATASSANHCQKTISRTLTLTPDIMTRLTAHTAQLSAPYRIPVRAEVIRWTTADGQVLSGIARFPPGLNAVEMARLPTVLFIHGGPYRRDVPDYMPYFCNWRELLASAGYLVISPNYRGSQGRGHAFARTASCGIGVYDWPDCVSMLDEVIRRGWADEERVGIAGWSHGGSLAAYGVTLTKTRFKAAVVGGAVSNWEGLVLESPSLSELEAELGGCSPWNPSAPGSSGVDSDTCGQNGYANGHDGSFHHLEHKRPTCPAVPHQVSMPPGNPMLITHKASPIHLLSSGENRVTTPVLILHGEKDERIPVGQAIGLYRGLRQCAKGIGKDCVEMAVYPREGHGFVEREHAEDVMTRALMHFKKWL